RGAGTGLSGGCVPVPNGIVLSLERLRKLDIDTKHKIAYIGPGLITKELVDATAEFGLTYPPDPASFEESTIGGNVAENAGGLRCKRFGVTKDYVIGLKAVTIKSKIINTGIYNDSEGFALGDIFTGSEGTLVIIFEIAVRLIPLPSLGNTILVAFDSSKNAAQAVSDINNSGIIPTVMEFLDGDAAACSNQYEKNEGLDNVAAILLMETSDKTKEHQTSIIKKICERNRYSYMRIEHNPQKAQNLWKIRRNLSKAVTEITAIRISEDVAVPNSKFPLLVEFVENMNHTSSLRINSFGHAGDGNLHVNFLSTDSNEKDYKLIEKNIEKLLNKAIELGGTLTGEHGIGLAKREFLPLEFGPTTISYMKKIKDIFDPLNLMNPDKIFPKN
ncbi:MAG: FAD-binding protein, partial [FCB group bacterium]|nr:FAD-binding protein [FCB group bacterium]